MALLIHVQNRSIGRDELGREHVSIVRPCLLVRYPIPPPSVIPPIPTEPVSPKPVASPCFPTPAEYSPAVRPVCAQAVRPRRVDLERLHVVQIEHDAAIVAAVPGAAVAAAADRERQAAVARQWMAGRHRTRQRFAR